MKLYVCAERLLEAEKRTKDSIYVYMGFTIMSTLTSWYIINQSPKKKISMIVQLTSQCHLSTFTSVSPHMVPPPPPSTSPISNFGNMSLDEITHPL